MYRTIIHNSLNPADKLAALREYERIHLADMEDAAQRGEEILLREIYKPKAERIKKYAETIAERIDLKDPMLDIQEKKYISTYIKQKYTECGVPPTITENLHHDVPEEYKNGNLARKVAIGGGDFPADNTPEVKKMDNLRLQQEDEKLADDEKKARAELARIRDVRAVIQEEASERHLSLPSMRSEVISTQKPEQADTEFSNVLIDISNAFMEVARKVIEFPPSPEDAERYAEAGKQYLSILKPLTDLKYTKDYRGWLETIKTYEEYGKHAAAVKNAIVTPSGVKRPLTREQVGDRAELVIEGAINMYNVDHLLVALAEHHRKYKEPRIGARKVDLHGKLSEQA